MHSYVGTVLSHDKLLADGIHPPDNGDKSSEDSVWLPMWWGNIKLVTQVG